MDPAKSFAIQDEYFRQGAVLALNSGTLVLTVGMIVLGAGLLRSRVVPRWGGLMVLLAPIVIQLAFALKTPTYLHGLAFCRLHGGIRARGCPHLTSSAVASLL